MKKIYYLLLFVLLPTLGYSQDYKVTMSATSGSYSTSPTVSFNVSWSARQEGKYNSKVWVLVDYKDITTGIWDRATITSVSAGSSGSTITANGRGFWLQGNNGAYSQKVTVMLSTGSATKFSWCAHVNDCPPNVTGDGGVYRFRGTPPFTLIAVDGVTKQKVEGKTLNVTALTIIPKVLTDATDCPGAFCPYIGLDLYIDATHACQLRNVGAQNWEAYIKDVRDSQIYRVTQFSDGTWWMAEDLNSAVGRTSCGGVNLYANQNISYCPSGWNLPTGGLVAYRWSTNLRSDAYGGSFAVSSWYHWSADGQCHSNTGDRVDVAVSDNITALEFHDSRNSWLWNTFDYIPGRVRCYR